MAGFEVIT